MEKIKLEALQTSLQEYFEKLDFSKGFAQIKIGEKYILINKNFEIMGIYDDVTNFKNGVAKVYIGQRYGFVD